MHSPSHRPTRATSSSHRRAASTTEVQIFVPTQGASVAFTMEDGPSARWKLYTGPIRLTGPTTIRARAIRYGYKPSAEARAVFSAGTAGR
jgi:N-sulfoglucosamine sulfohydrolase